MITALSAETALSAASRSEASPTGLDLVTVLPGWTLMMPGEAMARAAANAASARSTAPMGDAARSNRSRTLAEPSRVTLTLAEGGS